MVFKKLLLPLFILLSSPATAVSSEFIFPGEYTIEYVLNDGRYRFPVVYTFEVTRNQQLQGQVSYPSFRCQAELPATDFVSGSAKPIENMQGQRPLCGARIVTMHFGKDHKTPTQKNYFRLVPASGDTIVSLESYNFKPSVLSAFLISNGLNSPDEVTSAKPDLAIEYIRTLGLKDHKAKQLLNHLYTNALSKIDTNNAWQRVLVRDFTGHTKHQNLVTAFFDEYKKIGYEALLSFTDEMGSFLDESAIEISLDTVSKQLPHLNTLKSNTKVSLEGIRPVKNNSHLVLKLKENQIASYWRLPVTNDDIADVQGFLEDPKLNFTSALALLQQDPSAFVQQQHLFRSEQINSIEQWKRYLTRYPNSPSSQQAMDAISYLKLQAEEARLKQVEAQAAAQAARKAREEAHAERERRRTQAYLANKHLGQEVCKDMRAFFSAIEIKGFVEQVAGNRIQIRIHYTGGSSVTNYREQGIYWDDYTHWRACRF